MCSRVINFLASNIALLSVISWSFGWNSGAGRSGSHLTSQLVTPLLPAVLSMERGSGLAMNRESCFKEERGMVKRDKGLAEALVLPAMLF